MKILHVVPTYFPATRYGGPVYSVHGLCKELAQREHVVTVITTNVDGPRSSNVPLERPVDLDGVKVMYFPVSFLRRLYFSLSMVKWLKQEMRNFDLVHTHSIFLCPTLMAARLAAEKSVPYIVSPRGMLVRSLVREKNHLIKSMWINFLEKGNIENAAGIHFTSDVEKHEAEKFSVKMKKTFVIPNGLDMPSQGLNRKQLRPDVEKIIKERKTFILYLGRISWKKRLDCLVKAMPFIDDASLVIAGNDDERLIPGLRKLALECGVESRVFFLDYVSGENKEALFGAAKIFVLPSQSENFGMAVLEAMGAGCPVVVTPEVGLAPMVEKEHCGIVSSNDPNLMGPLIAKLLKNEQKMKSFSDAGRYVAKKYYAWECIARQMEEAYKSVLGNTTEDR